MPPAREPPQTVPQQHHWHSFASLRWYEEAISFLFTFAAKTSEVLLAAGLTVSTANFLTDGKVMGNSPDLATAWAWAQALAIDSSLGVTFYYVIASIKQQDWIKVLCYGLLTALLAVVAGTITNVDTFSHAIHISIGNAIVQVGLNVKLLTTLRAIAVVGFVLMSRLKEVSFKDLYEATLPKESQPLRDVSHSSIQENESITAMVKEQMTEALVPIMKALAKQGMTIVTEEQERLPLPLVQTMTKPTEQQVYSSTPQRDTENETQAEAQELPGGDIPSEEREARLARAYHELQAEGERISGRALAARAHVRRSTCNQWLAAHHPEVTNEEPEEEPDHGQW